MSKNIFEYSDASADGDKLSIWTPGAAIPLPCVQIDGHHRSLMVAYAPEDAPAIAAAILAAAGHPSAHRDADAPNYAKVEDQP